MKTTASLPLWKMEKARGSQKLIQGLFQNGALSKTETKKSRFCLEKGKVNEIITSNLFVKDSISVKGQNVVSPNSNNSKNQNGEAHIVSSSSKRNVPLAAKQDMESNLETFESPINTQSSSELDAKKVEEWLKGKSDGMIFECDDGDMGIFEEEYEAKMNMNIDDDNNLALDLSHVPSAVGNVKMERDASAAEKSNVGASSNDNFNGTYIDILVKTSDGEKFIRVKSSIDFESSLPKNLATLLAEPGNCVLENSNYVNLDGLLMADIDEPPEEDQNNGITDENGKKDSSNALPSQIYWIPESRVKPKCFKCHFEGCNQTFTKETKLNVHLLTHEDTRQFKCTFEGCDWCFTSKYRLKRHLSCHTEEKSFKCDEPGCNRKFTTVYNLNSHKSLHKRPSLIECLHSDCQEKFPTRRQMEFHFKKHDDSEAPYLCPIPACGKRFYSSTFLSSHLRVHQFSEEDLTCPIPECKKKYTRVCQLRQHMRGHTGERPFACTYEGCSWTFVTASRLTRHMRKHTGERKYICPEPNCEKSFMRPEHLRGHVISHTATLNGDKPFKCPIENCPAAFTAKSSVYVHLKKHTSNQITLYPCPIDRCLRRYRSRTSLKKHLMTSHSTPLDKINYMEMVPVVVDKPLEQNFEAECLLNPLESILPDIEVENMEINSQESSLILRENIAQSPPQLDPEDLKSSMLINQHINAMIDDAASFTSNNPPSVENLVSQASTENESSSRCTSPDGSLLSRRSSVIGTGSEIESFILPPLPEVNKGGSARTDFCSATILSARAKKRRLFRQQLENGEPNEQIESRIKDQLLPAGMLSSTSDVFLASSSISFVDKSERPPLECQLLQYDPPVVPPEIYSDTILDAIVSTELANPLCTGSENVFPETVMNEFE